MYKESSRGVTSQQQTSSKSRSRQIEADEREKQFTQEPPSQLYQLGPNNLDTITEISGQRADEEQNEPDAYNMGYNCFDNFEQMS